MYFEIVGKIHDVETIAIETSIRKVNELRKKYGEGRWRKLKGNAAVRLPNGNIVNAELHWDEAHGIGKREIKIKRKYK